jgi:hypothetical protein
MKALRTLLCLVFAGAPALWLPASAQALPGTPAAAATAPTSPPRGLWLPGGRSYLGLNLDRASRATACSGMDLTCGEQHRPVQLYTGTMLGKFWGVELGYLDTARPARPGVAARTQGLNLSLVGKTQLAPSVGIFGKVGTTYGRVDPSALAISGHSNAPDHGFGLSFGGGVSFDFTPRLSATLEWDSHDMRFGGAGRDPVRSTSLGLKYSY